MKPFSRIFIEVPVTYGEMIEVLTKLGYRPEFDGKGSRYINDKHDSYVLLRDAAPDEMLEKAYVAAYSSLLYGQGIIKEEESLIHIIQKNRLKKSKKTANTKQALTA
jgi:hypothetical protein